MENVLFGVQLCIKISIFNEKSDFCYSDHPEITPGLNLHDNMISSSDSKQKMTELSLTEGWTEEAALAGSPVMDRDLPMTNPKLSPQRPTNSSPSDSPKKIQIRDIESEVRIAKYYSHIYVLLYTCVIQRLLVDIACDMVLILPPFQHWWNVKGKCRCQKMLTERVDS